MNIETGIKEGLNKVKKNNPAPISVYISYIFKSPSRKIGAGQNDNVSSPQDSAKLKIVGFSLFIFSFSLLAACGTTQGGNPSTKIPSTKSQIPNKSQAPNSNILNPELEARIIQLVKDLDDNNQKTRINATEELIKIGEPALEDVKKALIKPPNNEVRIRATHIVSEIEFNAKKFKIAFVPERDGNKEIYI